MARYNDTFFKKTVLLVFFFFTQNLIKIVNDMGEKNELLYYREGISDKEHTQFFSCLLAFFSPLLLGSILVFYHLMAVMELEPPRKG